MYFLVHSLWSITSAKLSRASLQLNKHVILLQKGRKVDVVFVCVWVCMCVWLVPVATVWLYQKERPFKSLCGLFLMLTSQCLVVCVVWTRGYMRSVYMHVKCVCGHLSNYMCSWSMLWDWAHMSSYVCVCVCFTLPCPVCAHRWVYGAAAWAFLLTLSS